MKRTLFTLAFVLFGLTTFAQKFGHVNSQDILTALPEAKAVEAQINEVSKTLQDRLVELQQEYQKKVTEFQQMQQNPNQLQTILETKYNEIMELEKSIQQYQVNAEQELQKTQQDLLEPVVNLVKDAINAYGKENAYTYIFDNAMGIIVYENGDNLTQAIIDKLSTNAPEATQE